MSNRTLNWVSFIILVLIIGVQIFNFYSTRHDSFPGVWIVRFFTIFLVLAFLASFIYGAFFHPFTVDQIPPFFTLKYLRFRWYMWSMALVSIAAIPAYFAIWKTNNGAVGSRLLMLFGNQIETNLFIMLLTVVFDSLSRYFYQKALNANQNANQVPVPSSSNTHPQPSQSPEQMGYFSPKSKSTTNSTSHKNPPFDSGKFRYAR